MIQLPQPPQPPVLLDEAIELLRSDIRRNFVIDIESDSTIEPDEQAEQESRVEMLTAVTAFMQQALPAAQAAPQLAPVIGEFLLFTVRTFKAGRTLEATIESMVEDARNNPPQQQEDPQAAADKAKLQMEAEKAKQDAAIRQAELQQKGELAQQELQMKAQMGERELALKERQVAAEMQLKQAQAQNDAQLKRETASNDIAVKREQVEASKKPPISLQMTDDSQFKQLEGAVMESTKATQQTMQALVKGQAESSKLLAQAAQMIAQAAKEMSRPRVSRMQRADGSVLEARSEVE